MIDRTRRLLDGIALLAALTLPTTAMAQDARRGAPNTPDPVPAAPARTAETPAAPERSAEAPDARPSRRATLSKMRDGEVVHRERLASIHRLRELAEKDGQTERLALLDKLEVKENSRYANVAQLAANRLGDTVAYRQSLIKLADGRIRRTATDGSAAAPGQATANRKARNEAGETKGAADRGTATPQPGDTSAEKPKRERKHRDSAAGATGTGKGRAGGKHKRPDDAGTTTPRAEPKPEAPPPAPAPSGGTAPTDGRSPRSGS